MRPPVSKGKGGRGRGGGDKGKGGKGKGGFGREVEGPPDRVEEVGAVMHSCEGDIVCKLTNKMVPYFNASIFLDKDTKIGKVDEVFGPINAVMFTIKPDTGVTATSFKAEDMVSIDPAKLLPLARFTGPQSGGGGGKGKGKGGKGGKGKGRGRG
mmetsp:Transcript_19595/g.67294  ORF Transcript_19595/g.67294 Transcript_19595/m.67294 type:complete len:154 (-) Transcript_19595:140-601(-)